MAYRMARLPVTLSVLEGHSHLYAFPNAIFCICGASRGPSASAEFLVIQLLVLRT